VVLKNTKHLAIFTIMEVKIPHGRRLSVVFDNGKSSTAFLLRNVKGMWLFRMEKMKGL